MHRQEGDSGASGSLFAFFLLTFAVAWIGFVGAAVSGASTRSPVILVAVTLAAYTPSLVALALTLRASGRAGVRGLLARLWPGDVAARWYVFAASYMVAVKLTVAVIHRLVAGAWPRVEFGSWYLIPFAIAFSTPFQAGEEIGWRGFALPRMAARMGLGPASILLGAIWALWHLPLFFLRGADTYGQSFILYALEVVAISVAMAWLFGHARGRLLPVMLLHAGINNSKDIVPSATPGTMHTLGFTASLTGWLTVAVLWVCALAFLARMPKLPPSSTAESA